MKKRELIIKFFEDERQYDRVRRLCLKAYGNREDAEDAAHDLFISLISHADRINFPEDMESAFFYVETALYNSLLMKKRERTPKQVDLEDAEDLPEDLSLSPLMKVEKLDELVRQHADLFSEEQLKLWGCMVEFRTLDEMQVILGKERTTLYSLRNKLAAKIRRLVHPEEMN